MTRQLRYGRGALIADYVRAGAGTLICATPMLAIEPTATTIAIFGSLSGLFALFGAKTALRQASVVQIDDQGVAIAGPLGKRIGWDELSGMKLAYYTTRRDQQNGWMHLTLSGPAGKLRFDSALEQFQALVERATQAALARKLELTIATRANLAALNIIVPEDEG